MPLVSTIPKQFHAERFWPTPPWPMGVYESKTSAGMYWHKILTRDGPQIVHRGDWILRDEDGILSSCSAEDFAAKYQVVGTEDVGVVRFGPDGKVLGFKTEASE